MVFEFGPREKWSAQTTAVVDFYVETLRPVGVALPPSTGRGRSPLLVSLDARDGVTLEGERLMTLDEATKGTRLSALAEALAKRNDGGTQLILVVDKNVDAKAVKNVARTAKAAGRPNVMFAEKEVGPGAGAQ